MPPTGEGVRLLSYFIQSPTSEFEGVRHGESSLPG